MRTVINLLLTILVLSPITALYIPCTIVAASELEESGHSTLSNFTPLIALIIYITAAKLIYNLIRFLIKIVFG